MKLGIQGHRGARALFPENTLEGFLRSAALGVTAFELDVGLTADGVAVVHHDLALNPDIVRGPSGAWLDAPVLLRSLTYAELGRYDVGRLRPGSPAALLFPGQAPVDGARVPTLRAVLDALPEARFTVEVKTDPRYPDRTVAPEVLAGAALAVINEAAAARRVTVEAFDWRVPRHVRRVRPDIRLAWLTRAETAGPLWWGVEPKASVAASVAAEGGPIWAPDHRDLTEGQVRHAHALGLLVLPWTVNRPDDMRRLAHWGADGLISDRPDLALSVTGPTGGR
jgi:glycerophosphoryl diester phosphodiesterase